MNLPSDWQQALSSPVVILLLVIAAFTLTLVFILPLLLRFLPVKRVNKLVKLIKFDRKNQKPAVALILIIAVLAVGSYLFYYFNQPVRIVTATQFKLEKGGQIEKLQQKGLGAWKTTGLYLLDVRSRDEYALEHLKASASLPAKRAVEEIYPSDQVNIIVVYSSASKLEEARAVAKAIKKNGDYAKDAHKGKVGKIYVVKDGFEGLKKIGVQTESGVWD